ncbi:hypothetical protein C9374_010314 [Naegleria lovaniensis]|uniref:WWE domain-containing protein n=1 Tax=Naegleria lovaniensis TaxID=51637 RepID=A0AA88GC97_NAELO|nr:uncharacterized protein C9374_010314 [Naegleria lovaniensis]KAG2374940.1 hypothetical protein C9374_010314 [Naegleria lovaniensis]
MSLSEEVSVESLCDHLTTTLSLENLLEKERTFINQSLQEKYENEKHQLQLIEQERYEKFKQEQPHEFSKHVELTFMTTLRTINKRENLMKVMMTSEFMIEKDENGAILFADRNPFYFNMILEFLRTGSTTHIGLWKADSEVSMKHLVQLFEESNYFGCAKLSEAIQNRLKNCSLFREDEDDDACITHSFLENHIRVEEDVEPAKSEKIISFNVRGQLLYPIAIEKLVKHSESLFPSLLKETNENTIFLDRDPLVYHIIFDFLETGRFDEICKQDQQVKTQIKKEAKELNLLELLEYWNILRYHIEHLGYSNRRMKEEEDLLRRLFVSDRDHEILQNPYLHLLNVFDANQEAFMMKNPPKGIGLLFDFENPMEASKFKVSKPSIPHLCPDFETFQIQFDTLTCGIFDGMNWENVFCAGGCVLRAILATPFANSSNNPITDSDDELDDGDVSEATMDELEFYSNDFNRKKHDQHSATCFDENFQKKLISYYNKHERWSNTDIDLFLYGLTECEAEQKLVDIYKHFKKRLRAFKKATNQPKAFTDIMLIRTSHALTFRFYEPVRTVQVILRIYKSPSEILMGFDIPSCCFGYDGSNVYCLPRAKESLVTRTNIVDPDRQSTTYESRLVKYALRGFRIGIPNYQPAKVKANNFVDDECRRNGLAKILWLQNRYSFTLSHPGILTSAFDISSPSPNHDYCIVKIPKDLISPYWLHSRIKSQYTYAVEELNQHPFFDFTLNDINGILNLASNRSTLSAKIEWITLEPTRQYIGSFNPTDRNFFKDAYQTKQFKYIWEFKEGKKIFTPFNISESISLERHYRLNRSSFEIGTNNRVDFEDMVQIINEDTPDEIRRKVRRKKKVCSPLQKGED